jgi:hypothetical protein
MVTRNKNSNNSLGSSLTDLMTSLMIIFVLLLVATLNNASAEGENTRNLILQDLMRDLKDFTQQGVRVEKDPADPLGLVVLVPTGLMDFTTDGTDIPPKGVEFLDRFVPKLAGTACSENYRKEISSIVVEGYTDSTGTDEHNIPLSQKRSLSVVQKSLEVLGQKQPENRGCFLDFLSANGRGSKDPILDANGNEDKDRSRRVVFKIRVRSLEQRELRTILGS